MVARTAGLYADHVRFLVLALLACSPPARDPQPPLTPHATATRPAFDPTTDKRFDEPLALPAIPDAPNECEPFDVRNPACRNDPRMCLNGMADCKCPSPPVADNPACWAVMPCPDPPDRRVRACWPKWPSCPDKEHPDPDNPNCPLPVTLGRVIAYQATDTEGVITIGVGSTQGVSVRWKARLLRGESSDPLPNGEITILRVTDRVTVGTVRLRREVVQANSRVRLDAP